MSIPSGPTLYEIALATPASRHFSQLFEPDIRRSRMFWLKRPLVNRTVAGWMERGFRRVCGGSAQSVLSALEPESAYSFVVQDHRVAIAKKGYTPHRFVLSKHTVLGDWDPAYFAGELRVDRDGSVHVFNLSGSYRAGNYVMPIAKAFLETLFEGRSIVVHPKPTRIAKAVDMTSFQEFETKLAIPDAATMERLRAFEGKAVSLAANGRPARFRLKRWGIAGLTGGQWLCDDVYYDTERRDLASAGACLRRRIWTLPSGKIWMVELQAKGGITLPAAGGDLYYERDQVRGMSFKDLASWERWSPNAWRFPSSDPAVEFCRELGAKTHSLRPVLEVESRRYVLPAYREDSRSPLDRVVPQFFLSLDEGRYRAVGDGRRVADHRELEIELVDFLPLGLNRVTPERLAEGVAMARFFCEELGLTQVRSSKYEVGLRLVQPDALSDGHGFGG